MNYYLRAFMLFGCTFITGAAIHYFTHDALGDPYTSMLMWVFLSGTFLLYIRLFGKSRWALFTKPGKLHGTAWLLCLGILMLFFINNYFLAIYSSLNMPGDQVRQPLAWVLLSFAISSTGEEIVYRGFLQTYINQNVGSGEWKLSRGNIFATVLMTVAHFGFFTAMDVLFAVTGILLVCLFSLVAGYLRDRTGGLVVPILFHITVNYLHTLVQLAFGE